MTTLREQMIRDMQLRRFSSHTQESYVRAVYLLAKYYKLSPEKIDGKMLQDYVLYLLNERKLKWSSINVATAGLRFFYTVTINRKDLALAIPPRKTPRTLPEILSQEEILRLFTSLSNQKHRAILMTAYASGLRVSELINLRVNDIDSDRMMIRVEKGKGEKDRYTILSERLLKELRSYWKVYRPQTWLFSNQRTKQRLTRSTPELIFTTAKKKSNIKKKGCIHLLRHAFASHLLEAGVSIRTIQILLGHSSISTTSKYIHVARKNLSSTQSPLDLLNIPEVERFQEESIF